MKPRWRWWLFCASLWLDRRFGWRWARSVWAWSIPAGAFGEFDGAQSGGESPF